MRSHLGLGVNHLKGDSPTGQWVNWASAVAPCSSSGNGDCEANLAGVAGPQAGSPPSIHDWLRGSEEVLDHLDAPLNFAVSRWDTSPERKSLQHQLQPVQWMTNMIRRWRLRSSKLGNRGVLPAMKTSRSFFERF